MPSQFFFAMLATTVSLAIGPKVLGNVYVFPSSALPIMWASLLGVATTTMASAFTYPPLYSSMLGAVVTLLYVPGVRKLGASASNGLRICLGVLGFLLVVRMSYYSASLPTMYALVGTATAIGWLATCFTGARTEPHHAQVQARPPHPLDPELKYNVTYLDLPIELRTSIAQYLTVKDAGNARLVCSAWAADFAGALFNDGLVIRPDRDDRRRILKIASRPWLAVGIRKVEIYAGDFDENTLRQAIIETEEEQHTATATEIHRRRQILLKQFVRERHGYLDIQYLLQPFIRLPKLSSIKITSIRYPFSRPGLDLEESWSNMLYEYKDGSRRPTSHLNPAAAKNKYCSVLSVLGSSVLADLPVENEFRIEKLDLDLMPIDCFVVSTADHQPSSEDVVLDVLQIDMMTIAAVNIRDLRVCFVGCLDTVHQGKVGTAVGKWLGSMQYLQSLDLTCDPDFLPYPELTNAIHKALLDSKWPRLKSLRLKRTKIDARRLAKFLKRHSSSLKQLHLERGVIMPKGMSYYDFLTLVRNDLKLEKFEILTLVNEDGSHVPWCQDNSARIYDDNWESFYMHPDMHHNPEHISAHRLAREFEQYVLGHGPWRMGKTDPDEEGRWT